MNGSLPVGHYTLIMCQFSPARITSLSLWVDPEPAVKVLGCYCQRELGEWKGFVCFFLVWVFLFFSMWVMGMPDGRRLNGCYLQRQSAAVLMISAIKQQRCRRKRSESCSPPPATRQLCCAATNSRRAVCFISVIITLNLEFKCFWGFFLICIFVFVFFQSYSSLTRLWSAEKDLGWRLLSESGLALT